MDSYFLIIISARCHTWSHFPCCIEDRFVCKYVHKTGVAVNSTVFLSFLQVFDRLRLLTCLQYSLICQAISGALQVNQVFVIWYKLVIHRKESLHISLLIRAFAILLKIPAIPCWSPVPLNISRV